MLNDNDPFLYILMRSDMDSLNAAKVIVEVVNATDLFADSVRENTDELMIMFKKWLECVDVKKSVVLDVGTIENLYKIRHNIITNLPNKNIESGIVTDPRYPVKDGGTTHFIPVDTCGFVFTTKFIGDMLFRDLQPYENKWAETDEQ